MYAPIYTATARLAADCGRLTGRCSEAGKVSGCGRQLEHQLEIGVPTANPSPRQVWWIYGARNRDDHPFAEESRSLLKQLARGRYYVVYGRPAVTDRLETDFDASGHIDTALLEKIGVSRESDFYLCGTSSFLQNLRDGLRDWGVLAENGYGIINGYGREVRPNVYLVNASSKTKSDVLSHPNIAFLTYSIMVS